MHLSFMRKTAGIFWVFLTLALCAGYQADAQKKKPVEIVDSLLTKMKTTGDDTVKVWILVRLAQTYLSIHPATGVPYAYQGLALANKIGWKKGQSISENAIGLTIGDSGNNKEALVHYLRAYQINTSINNRQGMLNNLRNIGRVYERQGQYQVSIEYDLKALKLAREMNNNQEIANQATGLASVFIGQKDYVKAEEYAGMVITYGTLAHSLYNTGKGNVEMGVIKMEIKDTPAAKVYFDRALRIYEETGDQANILIALVNMSMLDRPDYRKELGLMKRAQLLADSIGAVSGASIVNIANIGNVYYEMALHGPASAKPKWLDSASDYMVRATRQAKENNRQEELVTFSLLLAKINIERGKYREAASNYKSYIGLNDSMYSQDRKNEIAGLEGKYQVDLKDQEIAISKIELNNQRRTRIALICGVALLAIIGVLIWWQSRLRKKSNTTLMVLNSQLDEANQVKTRFFGILSHDLRSPISNLVNFLQLTKNDAQQVPVAEQVANRMQISSSAEQLLETMETMLLWSKEQMEQFKPDIRLISVSDLFGYLQKFFANIHPVQLRFQDPGNLQVSGDENYLHVIMQNLTSNAVKVLRQSPAGIVEWTARKDGQKVLLSITDNGPGLDAAEARSLYDERTVVNTKNGFGFHLIRDLAKAIQYRISVETMPGKGTTFIIST